MTRDDLNYLKTWFTEYVSNFYSDDPDYNHLIRLKEEHTIRVCCNIAMLGKELGITKHEMVLAETIALFHDIGRFKQYKTYRTFNDIVSENHARLGLRQIAIHRVLSVCTTAEKRLITRAIAYHNAATLPVNENGNTLFFMRLIRDADKLDIWKLFIDYCNEREKNHSSAIELGLPDDPVYSQRVIESLKQRRLVLMQDLKTLNDFKLLQIGWVYDLNFVPSFQTVQNRKYIEKLEETLPQSKEIKEAAHSFGPTTWQTLIKVEIPQAMPTIMAGVNQTTMMAMAMVVVSSMIGAKGLGYNVLIAINRTDIAMGFEAGISIVFVAIIIDRLTQSVGDKFKYDK